MAASGLTQSALAAFEPLVAAAAPVAATEPAGGAAIDQIVIATLGASLIFGVLALLCIRHRSGRGKLLRVLGDRASRVTGMPSWAALPIALAGGSLVTALLGMYWDISLHIDVGRDEGPLANPAHYLILAGLFGVLASGMLAIYMPEERPGPAAVRLAGDWYAPVGGILLAAAGSFALIGFPLDDVWHRLFGQDVTLWGPTHLMLIGGAAMTIFGMSNLMVEGMRSRDTARAQGLAPVQTPRQERVGRILVSSRRIGLMGALLIGLSTFQAEFDFGVPQFALELEPLMLALAAGTALVCARIWIGPGGALAAALFFVVLRGAVTLAVGPILGQTDPHLPLYLAEAALVELVAIGLIRFRGGRLSPLALGTLGGLAIGTVGFAAEYGWSQIAMPIAWTPDILPAGIVLASIAGVAGGLIGAMFAMGLRGELPRPRPSLAIVAGSVIAVMAAVGFGLRTDDPSGVRAELAVTDTVQGATGREADVEVRFDPADVAADPAWLTVTAWQGGGLVVDDLVPIAGEPGAYRTASPVPIDGNWKTMVRLHSGDAQVGAPIFLPEDSAIPAPEVPAPGVGESVNRAVASDVAFLQREQKQGVAGWLQIVAPLIVLAITLVLIALLSWGSNRVGRIRAYAEPQRPIERREPETAPARGSARGRGPVVGT